MQQCVFPFLRKPKNFVALPFHRILPLQCPAVLNPLEKQLSFILGPPLHSTLRTSNVLIMVYAITENKNKKTLGGGGGDEDTARRWDSAVFFHYG